MTTTQSHITARRPGPRSWGILIKSEAKTLARDYASLLLPLGLPLLVLLTSASMASSEAIGTDGFTAFEFYVLPIVLTMVFAYIGMLNMPTYLSYYRKSGILRRLGATPASPMMVLVSQIVVNALLSLIGIALALSVSFVFFDAVAPASALAVAGAILLVMVSMYGIGMIIASLAPTMNAAIALGIILFLGLGALGGMFGGRSILPEPLQEVSQYLPFGAASDLLAATWTGQPVEPTMIIPLVVAAGASVLISLAFFRWE
ncbi:ABC transporter permease [uncultured Agrococcus sp.]|uniref:ABC transporter permease n=1 Tax=uncultured Agrococcus sp. TaxID=382258 RepID=UPI0025E9AB88|nr:ABC transporter permease [uncultured Agrococcus sp.]